MLEMLKNGGVRNKIADFGQKSKLSVFVPQILMSLRRLQMWQEKKEIARLMPPLRFAQQMRSTNLLMRMEEPHLNSIFRHIFRHTHHPGFPIASYQ